MTDFKVHFAAGAWGPVRKRLLESAPVEDGAFFLAQWTAPRLRLHTEVSQPPEPWDAQGELFLKPSTAYLNRVAAWAEREDAIPVFIHTHPMGWAEFSYADEHAHDGWRPFFEQYNTPRGFASLLWAMRDWNASLWLDGRRFDTMEVLHE